jgi:Leucine-rich repeat (LRR) protein
MTWQGITCSSIPMRCETTICDIVSLILISYDLDGTIPAEIFSRVTLLTTFQIFDSPKLTGTISSAISSLSQLQTLDLSLNQLSGPIPSELSSLPQLEIFSVGSNQLSGSIPSGLTSLSQLQTLDLSFNQLSGPIPSELSSLPQLQVLFLTSNHLTGSILSQHTT